MDAVKQIKSYPNQHVDHETQELQRVLNAQSKLKNLHQKDQISGDLSEIQHL